MSERDIDHPYGERIAQEPRCISMSPASLAVDLAEAQRELAALKRDGSYDDLLASQRAFIALAKQLRELGATSVTDGTMSVTFAPQPKLVATLPLTRTPTEAPPGVERVREWRDGTGQVVVNPPVDLNTREGRDALRAETLKQLGMVK